jgi:D-lactate dehydrogenase (cytochrome)
VCAQGRHAGLPLLSSLFFVSVLKMNNDLLDLFSFIEPERRATHESVLMAHARDESVHEAPPPDMVIWPADTSEVSRILRTANANRIPVTAWGGGSSLEGNPIPVQGGIVLDMTGMNRVLDVMRDDFQARVQPGILGDDLNKRLARDGLFFPANPGSSNIATVGGMIANNAGGMYAIKYGVVRDSVMALEVVLANGEILQLGSRSMKSVAGYDLVSLFVGSEGTLGVVTEATLRLYGLSPSRAILLASFPEVQQAADATLELLGSGIDPAALELMDTAFVRLANQVKDLAWPEAPTLLVELHSIPKRIEAELAMAEEICRDNGSTSCEVATTESGRSDLWEGRKGVRPALRKLLPNTRIVPGDVGVPVSKIPELAMMAQQAGERHDVRTVTFGHAGDGNVHVWILYAEDDRRSFERAQMVDQEIIQYALSVGGTASSEHGIGISKRAFLAQEHPSSIEYMAAVKRLFDPNGILNPGKIFPE